MVIALLSCYTRKHSPDHQKREETYDRNKGAANCQEHFAIGIIRVQCDVGWRESRHVDGRGLLRRGWSLGLRAGNRLDASWKRVGGLAKADRRPYYRV